jgi:ABC-type Fe3+/spermidine/putrescine transport system ATPase subunit
MQKAIEVTNLCKRYSQEVLKNFSLSVNEGEMVVLLGESGCGKSTFIRILAGLENADSGSVCLNGISTDERIPPNKRKLIGMSSIFPAKASPVPKAFFHTDFVHIKPLIQYFFYLCASSYSLK